MRRVSALLGLWAGLQSAVAVGASVASSKSAHYDLVVVGGTPSGVLSAVASVRTLKVLAGRSPSVALFSGTGRVGGMCSGGLGKTDVGRTDVIAGLAYEVFHRNGLVYGKDVEWNFEPHVAETVFLGMLQESNVSVHFLQRPVAVQVRATGAWGFRSVLGTGERRTLRLSLEIFVWFRGGAGCRHGGDVRDL